MKEYIRTPRIRVNPLFIVLVLGPMAILVVGLSFPVPNGHPAGTCGQKAGPENEAFARLLAPEELGEDFTRLRAALEQGHAGLYRYSSKAEMDGRFAALSKRLERPLPLIAFYREILILVAAIRDGHTSVQPPAGLAAGLRELPCRLPMALHFEGERVRVLHVGSTLDPSIAGAEVVAMNGRPMKEVTESLFRYLRGDGFSRTGRHRLLEDPEVFGTLYFLAFGLPEQYSLQLRSPDGLSSRLNVPGVTRAELRRSLIRRPRGTSPPPASYRFDGDIAVFTLTTFGAQTLSRAGIAYPQFLKDMFRALDERGTKALIIDLRDNGGGSDPYGMMLYAHLTEKPFLYYDRLEMNRERYEFLRWTGMKDPDRLKPALRRDEKGRLVRTDHPNLGIKPPLQPVFGGTVYALVNGGSFSATGEFLSVFRANRRGLLIGEESGAGRTGNTSGISIGLKLPNSEIAVFIPMVGYYMAGDPGPHPERGLLPDHEVIPTVEDILEGRDPVLEFALDLARRSRQKEISDPSVPS